MNQRPQWPAANCLILTPQSTRKGIWSQIDGILDIDIFWQTQGAYTDKQYPLKDKL